MPAAELALKLHPTSTRPMLTAPPPVVHLVVYLPVTTPPVVHIQSPTHLIELAHLEQNDRVKVGGLEGPPLLLARTDLGLLGR
jgi:hypothetical protein